jgi:hypothetical protein
MTNFSIHLCRWPFVVWIPWFPFRLSNSRLCINSRTTEDVLRTSDDLAAHEVVVDHFDSVINGNHPFVDSGYLVVDSSHPVIDSRYLIFDTGYSTVDASYSIHPRELSDHRSDPLDHRH